VTDGRLPLGQTKANIKNPAGTNSYIVRISGIEYYLYTKFDKDRINFKK